MLHQGSTPVAGDVHLRCVCQKQTAVLLKGLQISHPSAAHQPLILHSLFFQSPCCRPERVTALAVAAAVTVALAGAVTTAVAVAGSSK